jgi:uncharacterized protein YijF (DUF1287 family)
MKKLFFLVSCLILVSAAGCRRVYQHKKPAEAVPPRAILKPWPATASPQLKLLVEGTNEQTNITTEYDPAYVKISYPGGDVPAETGVCSDVLVRAFRKAGVDLQTEIHEDMVRDWDSYPKKWGARGPDSNIDHRRVLNLMTYFNRQGKSLPISNLGDDYLPGDVVAWDLGGSMDHIGIVSNLWSESDRRCLIVHNIGAGARVENVLFAWKITGHYRYFQ